MVENEIKRKSKGDIVKRENGREKETSDENPRTPTHAHKRNRERFQSHILSTAYI